jgi:hypothetical protein
VSITLDATSYTRITASCESLENLGYSIAPFAYRVLPQSTEWGPLIRSSRACGCTLALTPHIFAQLQLVPQLHSLLRCIGQFLPVFLQMGLSAAKATVQIAAVRIEKRILGAFFIDTNLRRHLWISLAGKSNNAVTLSEVPCERRSTRNLMI